MNILFIGDIVGKCGRKALLNRLPSLKEEYKLSFIIANAENISGGKGMIYEHYEFLKKLGVDCITLGNHFLSKKEINDFIDNDDIVRPLNLINYDLGEGSRVFIKDNIKIRVSNLLGFDTYKNDLISNPYECLVNVIAEDDSDIHIVDCHAEYSGEKRAVFFALKGTVTALIGSHTHVQTNDAEIRFGCAYITDCGMCGSLNGILGNDSDSVIERIVYKNPNIPFREVQDDQTLFSGVVITINDLTFKAEKITPLLIKD